MVKNRPAMQDTQVPSLGQEDSLEKGIAIHSSILAWRIPWTEKPGRLQSMGSQRVKVTNTHTHGHTHRHTHVLHTSQKLSPSHLRKLRHRGRKLF